MNKRIAFWLSVLIGLTIGAQVVFGQTSSSISNLSAGTPLQATDVFPIARSGGNYKITGTDIQTFSQVGVALLPTINDAPGRSLVTTTSSTGFQINSTRPATACYEGSFSTTSTIGGPASASVFLETAATNSTTPSDWTTKATQTYTNTITLAIVLNQVQGNNWSFCRSIPAGKFVRVRSGSISGTASASINAAQQETTW